MKTYNLVAMIPTTSVSACHTVTPKKEVPAIPAKELKNEPRHMSCYELVIKESAPLNTELQLPEPEPELKLERSRLFDIYENVAYHNSGHICLDFSGSELHTGGDRLALTIVDTRTPTSFEASGLNRPLPCRLGCGDHVRQSSIDSHEVNSKPGDKEPNDHAPFTLMTDNLAEDRTVHCHLNFARWQSADNSALRVDTESLRPPVRKLFRSTSATLIEDLANSDQNDLVDGHRPSLNRSRSSPQVQNECIFQQALKCATDVAPPKRPRRRSSSPER